MTRSPPTAVCAELAAFVGEQAWEGLPATLRRLVVDHVVDTVGCCVAGVGGNGWQAAAGWLEEEGGEPEATAAGIDRLVTRGQAALVNGLLARSGEFDDMAMPDLHPGGVIVPTVLAAAEFAGRSGGEALAAMAAGLEVMLRLGRAAYDRTSRESRFLRRGQDATALCGTVAAAAAAARLIGLDAAGISHAMGIAVSLASGSLEGNRSGGTVKQFQSGWAARSGLTAAALAGRGVTGPERALEGGYGFYACFTAGEFDRDVLTGELAHRWEAEDLRYKPYPSNYYTHAGIDAARSLRRQGLDVGRVETIRQLVASPMLRTMGSPLDAKRRPRDGYAAKFSGPYTVAAALLGGGGLGLGVDDFRDALVTDSARVRLMDRITVHADRRCDEVFPDHAPCVLEIHTKDGHVWREEVWENRGSAQNPLDSAEVASKFFDNTRRTMPQESAERLNEQLRSLPEAPHVRDVTALLSSPHVR